MSINALVAGAVVIVNVVPKPIVYSVGGIINPFTITNTLWTVCPA